MTFSGCTTDEQTGILFDQSAFEENQSAWNANNLQNYTFTFTMSMGDAYPKPLVEYVTVANGTGSVSFKEYYDEDGYLLEDFYPSEGDACYITNMQDVFDLILSSYNNDKEEIDAGTSLYSLADYKISYDETYNYPITAVNDYILKDDGIVGDSGFDIAISDFTTD